MEKRCMKNGKYLIKKKTASCNKTYKMLKHFPGIFSLSLT